MFVEIPGFPDYFINDEGKVLSICRGGKILMPDVGRQGYHRVTLFNSLGQRRKYCVHRLVMLAWVGPSVMQVNHINGNKADNHLSNLEYCTPGYNQAHALATGLKRKGEKSPVSVLSDAKMLELYRAKGTMLVIEAGKLFGVSKSLVSLTWLGQGRIKDILRNSHDQNL